MISDVKAYGVCGDGFVCVYAWCGVVCVCESEWIRYRHKDLTMTISKMGCITNVNILLVPSPERKRETASDMERATRRDTEKERDRETWREKDKTYKVSVTPHVQVLTRSVYMCEVLTGLQAESSHTLPGASSHSRGPWKLHRTWGQTHTQVTLTQYTGTPHRVKQYWETVYHYITVP